MNQYHNDGVVNQILGRRRRRRTLKNFGGLVTLPTLRQNGNAVPFFDRSVREMFHTDIDHVLDSKWARRIQLCELRPVLTLPTYHQWTGFVQFWQQQKQHSVDCVRSRAVLSDAHMHVCTRDHCLAMAWRNWQHLLLSVERNLQRAMVQWWATWPASSDCKKWEHDALAEDQMDFVTAWQTVWSKKTKSPISLTGTSGAATYAMDCKALITLIYSARRICKSQWVHGETTISCKSESQGVIKAPGCRMIRKHFIVFSF